MTHIWTMSDKNGCLPNSNYFEIELSFLSKDIPFLHEQISLFFIDTATCQREAPIDG
jgi:hypothetical protein